MENLNKMEEQLKVTNPDCFVCVCVRERRNREVEITTISKRRKRVMGPRDCQESYWNQKLSPASLLCSDHAATTAL